MQVNRLRALQPWNSTVHVLVAVACAPFLLLPLVLVVVGVLTLPLLLAGLPLIGCGLYAAAAAVHLERVALATFLGLDVPEVAQPSGPRRRLRSGTAWRTFGHSATLAALVLAGGVPVLGLFAVGATLLLITPLQLTLRPAETSFAGMPVNAVTTTMSVPTGLAMLLAGVLLATLVARAELRIRAWFVGEMATEALQQRIADLEGIRAQLVDAAEAERRRIERDLHDGAQQRLLALSMVISRARRQLSRDTDKADALLAEARQEAAAAMEELRSIARGTHPPILTEYGLEAAVAAAARRHPAAVTLHYDLDERPTKRTEAVAYYVVSEALTNVEKHAAASKAEVRVWREDDRLCLSVWDDGLGGAKPAEGGGLAGLTDRLRGVDGVLTVTSPPGGPSVVKAELPWQS